MDDQGESRRGRRPDDGEPEDARASDADQDYSWGGQPGEDFGPITPPAPRPTPGERRPLPPDDPVLGDTARYEAPRSPISGRRAPFTGEPLRPDGVFTPPIRRRHWAPRIAALGALVVLGALTAAVLVVISRPGLLGPFLAPPTASPEPTQAPAAASPTVAAAASPAVSPTASPAPAASPTPLALGTPSPSPAPARSPTATAGPTRSPAPVIFPTFPVLVTPPPGLRFPTSTPARLTTPAPTRTAPPVPTPRLPNVSTRVWSEQVMHRVGEEASICGQTSVGSSAELIVIAPDRTTQTLGEFTPPAERVCYTLRVDQPELWVLTLIVKDASGTEIERQSAALWVSP